MNYYNIKREMMSQRLQKWFMIVLLYGCFSTVAKAEIVTQLNPSTGQNDSHAITNETVYIRTTFSIIGKPKYPENFEHFDYVNPNAPKGGTLRLAEVGNYDNFNRLASRGVAERQSGNIYETLFMQSTDELNSYYPLLATSITYSDKYQWAEVTLNPQARFSDGVPVTAQDVEFTFNKLMTEGVPQYRMYCKGITVKAINLYRVRFEFANPNREQLLTFIGDFRVLPLHFWLNKNLAEPLATPPVGSGPYVISDYKMGQFVVYKRNQKYWGRHLPVNKGLNNFDYQRIDYYLDDAVALEAFKSGEYDFRIESQPKNWFTQYQGNYFNQGYIIKQQDEVTKAVASRWLAFNLERPIFQDIRIRQALTLAFDFAWLNHAFYYDSFIQPMSFFAFTPYAAQGKPSWQELKFLNPYRDTLPASVFDEAYHITASDGKGFNRENLLRAKQLLAEAGWVVKENKLVNQKTGQPFRFELLAYIGSDIKYAIPFQQSLAKLGIEMTITTVDYAQVVRRMRGRDFDMMATLYSKVDYPTSDLKIVWGSEFLNSSYNTSGLHHPAIDELIALIPNYIDDEEQLMYLGRALDRILTQQYPMIPMWSPQYINYAYWDKFNKPSIKPVYSIGLNTWWFSENKAVKLPHNK